MSDMSGNNAEVRLSPRTKLLLLLLILVTLPALAAVVFLAIAPGDGRVETIDRIVTGSDAEAVGVYRMDVIDATARDPMQAHEGRRYHVIVDDESKEGAAGIARIGGLVTFVPGARKGEELVIEVVRVKRSTAEAVIVERIAAAGQSVAFAPAPAESASADDAVPGRVFDVTIGDRDRKNPERDGVARIGGLVVFVRDARQGERVRIRIVERRERHAVGEVIGRLVAEEVAR
jgi:predicted RNA-binding protein with TRAM domain